MAGLLAVLLFHQVAEAFCTIYLNGRGTSGITRLGATRLPLFEPRTFPLDIFTEGVRPEIGAIAWESVVEEAANRWNSGDGDHPLVYSFDPITPIDSGVIPVRGDLVAAGDGHNVVSFDDVGDLFLDSCVARDDEQACLDAGNVLGITFTYAEDFSDSDVVIIGQTITRVITEERVIMVDGFAIQVVHVTGIEKEPREWTTDPVRTPGYDLESVITHEVGHLLGLDHAGGDTGCREDHPEAVMWESTGRDEVRRDLAADDIEGLYFLYEGVSTCGPHCLFPEDQILDIPPVIMDTTQINDRIQNGEPWFPVSAYILGNRDGDIGGNPDFKNRIDLLGGRTCWEGGGEDFSGEMARMVDRHYYEFPIRAMDRAGNFWPPGTRFQYALLARSVLTGHLRSDPEASDACYQFGLLHPPHQVGEPYYENTGITIADVEACHGVEGGCLPVLHDADDLVDVNWVDYDNDGDLDLFTLNRLGDPVENLFRNDHDPADPRAFFSEISADPPPRFSWYGNKVEWGALPGDERIDTFLYSTAASVHAYENTGERSPFHLEEDIRNDSFSTDMEVIDFNNDGLLDISVVEYHAGLCPRADNSDVGRSITLFQGMPDGSFEDVTLATGFVPNAGVGTVKLVWGDYNNDGFVDVAFINGCDEELRAGRHFPGLSLFRNNGDGTFSNVPEGHFLLSGSDSGSSDFKATASWVDLDNNGFLDLYYVIRGDGGYVIQNFNGNLNQFSRRADGERSYVGQGPDGAYWGPRELACFDYDNDGDEDCYVVNQDPPAYPNLLIKNNGSFEFTTFADSPDDGVVDYAAWVGLNQQDDTRSLAVGDYDKDGYLDIFLANADDHGSHLNLPKLLHNIGGPPEPGYPNGLGHAYNWVDFNLIGQGPGDPLPDGTRPSNRSAIGARVFIRSQPSGTVQNRFVRPVSEHSLPVHFGLKEDTVVDRVYVRWPGGIKQTLTGLAANQEYTVNEGERPFVNEAPRFQPIDPIRVGVGHEVTFTVQVSDFEMGEVTLTHGPLPAGATFDDGTKVFTWTPTRADAGPHSVSFMATDGELTSTLNVEIEVHTGPVLRPLDPALAEYSVIVGSELTIFVSADDPDGDRIAYSFSGLPMAEGLGINAVSGEFSWVPRAEHVGRHMATFTATTPDGQSDSITVPIVVNPAP